MTPRWKYFGLSKFSLELVIIIVKDKKRRVYKICNKNKNLGSSITCRSNVSSVANRNKLLNIFSFSPFVSISKVSNLTKILGVLQAIQEFISLYKNLKNFKISMSHVSQIDVSFIYGGLVVQW